MKRHDLKLDSAFWEDVLSGRKPFEVRKNDRGFQKGDIVSFRKMLDGRDIFKLSGDFEITYVLSGWGIETGYVVFGIKKLPEETMKLNDETTKE